jgi:diguanylate cyclase (GGDEF)-like protein
VQVSRSRSTGSTVAGLIDDKTEREVDRLRFAPGTEAEFERYFIARSLPRARWATAIYLVLVTVMTAINMLGSMAPLSETLLRPIYLLRLGVSCPALVLILAATAVPALQRRYQWIAASSVIALGVSVMTMSALAAAAGQPQFQLGDVLVVVYATLFLGLMSRPVVVVGTALMLSFVGIGWYLGVPSEQLIFASCVVFATILMSTLSALRMERLLRLNFVENRLLNDFAERDGLTGLYNRRLFDTLTNRLWQQAQRDREALQVILVDIDHFKAYNDLYGHQAGDQCIRRVAAIVARAAKRPFDFCARYGGEEFAIVLYAPAGTDPTAVPEQIRRETLALAVPHSRGEGGILTVSVGSAIAVPDSKRSLAGLIQSADEALYRAKQLGRNRVLHVNAAESGTSTGSFRVFAFK